MNSPLVSILTTVYNREKYISVCIDSVLASTYGDWELIIVDDVSSDTSVAIARSYEKKDTRIKVYVNEKNLGDYPNRNKAASYAKGKYLKYLDADDLIYPHDIEVMLHTMEQFPEAGLGISQKVAEDIKPYPFLMDPKETFYP
jgi:glycosyltransferase involved in cell wall biosynthesis